jgi:hypothetical protein
MHRVNKVKQVLEEATKRPKSIPCIVFDSKEQIMQYLGYRHVTVFLVYLILEAGLLLPSKHLNMKLYQYF